MAIRSGSGSLKYPLPNQAQLVAQQSAAAASAGGSAAASTFGANRAFAANKMRVQADLANSAADRQYRAMAQLEGQNFEAQQNFYDRENRKGSQLEAQRFDAEQQGQRFDQARELQWQNQYFDAEQNRQQLGARAQEFEANRQFDLSTSGIESGRETTAGIEKGLMSGQLQFPEGSTAAKELRELEAGRSLVQKGDWSAAQRAEYENQYLENKNRILSMAVPRPQPSLDEDFSKNVMEKDGVMYQRGKNGFEVLREPKDTSKQDEKQVERARGYMDDVPVNADGKPGTPLTPEQARQKVIEENATWAKGFDPEPAKTAPVPLPPGHPNAPPPVPQPPPPQPPGQLISPPVQGMGDSARQRSGSTGNAATPGAGGGTYPVASEQNAIDQQPDFITGPDGKIYVKQR
jgi:hypothetical protein